MKIEKPMVVDMGVEKRLNVSHVKALAYVVQETGPTTAMQAGAVFQELFPEVARPQANWQTLMSQAAYQGLVVRAGRGIYVGKEHKLFS